MVIEVSNSAADLGRLDPSQSVAVLIGVREYLRSDLPSVGAAHENVRRLAAELADEQVWGLPQPMRLVMLLDPERATVLSTVADAGKLVGRQGMLLIYFVGHAEPAGTELCLAMKDAERSRPTATMVTVSDLVAAAGGSRVDKRMLVLDTCYSGRAASRLPGVSVKVGETAGWYFVGAVDGKTQASAPPDGETTVFTTALLEVLKGSPGWDERLTPTEVWRQVSANLPPEHQPVHNDMAWAQQLPWLKNRRHVPQPRIAVTPMGVAAMKASPDELIIPTPPALYAEPHYIGSHPFTGRASQLETLDDWASPAQSHPVLMFEAIGGTGKSMLTWEWIRKYAAGVRGDWAGLFWYSFYEKGAVMADFCQRALAYMFSRPPAKFKDFNQAKLTEMLLQQLHTKPWLLVLDGLERVLVAYHRYDAGQMADEQAGQTDEIASRDPTSAIRPLDDDLLRQLAIAAPSKILITSRLTPRVLLNSASQPIPGVRVERLTGLRPPDAEALLRACGVRGDSHTIQDFLQRHCDCHPLITGVVAGLINEYLPARSNFDRWAADPAHGGRLNLGDLDLVQKREHILSVALQQLPGPSRQLLSAVSLLPGAVGYTTLDALNPHRPPPPEEVAEPLSPESGWRWSLETEAKRAELRAEYARSVAMRRDYEQRYAKWKSSKDVLEAPDALAKTVRDLERRGLMQYDRQAGRWDLHPVVRATVKTGIGRRDLHRLGQQIIDHFSQQSHDPFENADTIDDLHNGITVVKTMIHIGRIDDGWKTLKDDLGEALLFNLEAYPEFLTLVRPMFTSDFSSPVSGLAEQAPLAAWASVALASMGLNKEAEVLSRLCVQEFTRARDWPEIRTNLDNLTEILSRLNRLTISGRCMRLGLELAGKLGTPHGLLASRHSQMKHLATLGLWAQAEEAWKLIEPTVHDMPRRLARPGDIQTAYLSNVELPSGRLTEEQLAEAQRIATSGRSRLTLRKLQYLRGLWRLQNAEPIYAVESFQEAVRMANEAGFPDYSSEVYLALAQLQSRPDYHVGARELALRISARPAPPHLSLAKLWQALGDIPQAVDHARAAYAYAWADGEPYVRRFELTQATALLQELGAPVPVLPAHDPAAHPIEDWEREAASAIAKYRGSDNAR